MEINLLAKFSHSVHVLSYYDYFVDCRKLMMQLGKSTSEAWIKHQKAFHEALKSYLHTLYYLKDFDDDILDYLTKNNIYQRYYLDISLKSAESYVSFGEFLNMIPDDKPALIIKITISIIYNNVNEYCNFYHLLMAKNYSNSILQLEYSLLLGYEVYNIPYIPYLEYWGRSQSFERIGWIHIINGEWAHINKAKKYKGSIDNLIIGYTRLQKYMDIYGKDANDVSCKCIGVYNIPKDFEIDKIVEFLVSTAPFVTDKQFILKFKQFSTDAIDFAFLSIEEMTFCIIIEFQNMMTCKTLEFGSPKESSLLKAQATDYLMAYITNDGSFKFVKSNTFEIQFNDKFVIYADDSIIVLKKANYVKFEEFKAIEKEDTIFQKYEEFSQKPEFQNSLVLLNRDFIYFYYQAKGTIMLTYISGKYLHLFLKTNNIESMTKILSFIDKIPKSIEVAIEIDLNKNQTPYLSQVIEKCAESLKIVKLVMHYYRKNGDKILAKYEVISKVLSLSSLREFEHHPSQDSKDIYYARSLDKKDWNPQIFLDCLKSAIDMWSDGPLKYEASTDYSDYISIR